MTGFRLADLLNFEKTLALSLLKLVYFLGLAGIAIGAIIAIFGALATFRFSASTGLGSLLLAVGGACIGVLVWRVVCEMWMVVFGIHARLGEIRDQLAHDRASAG
ncbi:MAG: DUF4282 domain-containing protein [Gemmatimonadota bacterium]